MFRSSRQRSTHRIGLLAVIVIIAAVLPFSVATANAAASVTTLSADEAIAQITAEDGMLRFDVAEDATRFVWTGDPALENGKPAHGTPYVTQGYIYPEGMLTESNGVLPDGSPEFPDKVLGQWSCMGWWVGDPAHVDKSAPWITTHLFTFGEDYGEAMLVSEGYSIDELAVPLDRAIVGGTGPYDGARGVQQETNLGFNATDGVNVRYELHLAGA